MSGTSNTNIKIPTELKKELKKIAIDEDTSLSGLILKIIEESVEARKKEEKKENDNNNRMF